MENQETDPLKEAFRKKVADFEARIEGDAALWDRIRAEIDSQKVVRYSSRNLWYAAAATVALLIAGSTFMIFFKEAGEAPIAQTHIERGSHSIKTHSSKDLFSKDSTSLNQIQKQSNGVVVLSKKKKKEDKKLNNKTINAGKEILVSELEDHSRITLNKGSSIEIAGNYKDERNISLKGEAFFEVQGNRSHPFTTFFSGGRLVVIGTKFNVKNISEKSAEITVSEGIVKVFGDNDLGGTELSAGNFLLITDGKSSVPRLVNPSKYIAWKGLNLHFKNAALQEVVAGLSAQYGVEIDLPTQIKKCRFTGDLSQLGLEESLNIVCITSSLKLSKEAHKYYLTGNACD